MKKSALDVAKERGCKGLCPACGEPSIYVDEADIDRKDVRVTIIENRRGEELFLKCSGCSMLWSFITRKH